MSTFSTSRRIQPGATPHIHSGDRTGQAGSTGQRRRMYVVERAYQDYGGHLRRSSARLWSSCGEVWVWFWSGGGAKAIEFVLRCIVILSGIAAGTLYVRYEFSHNRGFSLGMLFSFCLIVMYVGVLLWGWKSPVHFGARTLAGASAAGVVVALTTLALSTALVVFSIYLLVLFLATALSFVVFLPMRAGQEIWLLYRRIAYHCPYDDCPFTGLPIHVCSCGAQYDDLLPSFYGLFYHTCRDEKKNHLLKLPTMNILGRNKLPRLCGGCQRPLIHSSVGEVPVKPIAVIGGASTGKTIYVSQATRALLSRLKGVSGALVKIDSDAQRRDVQRNWELLDRGQVLPKTGGTVMNALGLIVEAPELDRCLVHVYDAPGEHFATMQQFGQKQVLSTLSGIVLLVDMFSLPGLSRYGQRIAAQVQPSQMQLHQIVSVLLGGVNQFLVTLPNERCTLKLAVVLNKADALPVDDSPFLRGLYPTDGSEAARHKSHLACRNALEQLGEGRSVRALEQKFTDMRYYPCSALGRAPQQRDTRPFEPRGVAEPLLWLLGLSEDRSASPRSNAS